MLNKMKYILEIGSSTLRLVAVTKFAGQSRIVAEESVLYDGFMNGEFLTVEALEEDLSQLIGKMKDKIRKPITQILVGVPSEFCVCVCKRISRKYIGLHKVTENDLKNLYLNNADFGDSEEYVVVNYSPMQYVLDDNFKTLSPVGKKTSSLILDASYVLAKKTFVELISQKLSNLNINSIDYACAALGQAMECKRIVDSKKPIAIIDVGHITTSVCVYKGEGLALLSSFSMGGGHISSDIMQILNLNFKDAEIIKRKVILTIENTKNDYYEVCSRGNLVKAPINITNQIVKSRIEIIAKVIADILTVDNVFENIDVYLTGDGITNFKGVKNILKDATRLNVYEYKNPFDNSKDKYQTLKHGLVALLENMI